ncbi:MAG TPA: NUDIX domain-containing protein [Verrucomicrobiae bacterium]|nr:NUDIX domain-containing protein [Verrucomicrobiae bacterium]
MAEEIFDVVDGRDRVVGAAPRSEVHARKLRHRAVHVFLFNLHHELFVQKRSAAKDTFPGCYDSSASGHLNSGEDYDACAVRELEEELGVMLPASMFRKHFKIEACADTGWEFVWVYSVITDAAPRINLAELESGKFWTRERVRQLLATRPEQFARSFPLVFREFDQRRLWPVDPSVRHD